MKVWLLAPGENWIVDRMVDEFKKDNLEICTNDPKEATVCWAMADWCFDKIPRTIFERKVPIVMMCHHFVPEKFDAVAEKNFKERDQFVSVYTVPNFRTRDFISKMTKKKIHVIPYWLHSPSWGRSGSKLDFRKKYGVPTNAYVIGSFQRDTEGHDLKSPKLEKGPDLFCDFVEKLAAKRKQEIGDISPTHVLLAGWRRQYVIKRLTDAKIPFTYIELPNQETVNELYQCLDLYPVCSRYEGGPQAYGESAANGIHMVSRPVGMAESALPASAINEDVSLAKPAVPNVDEMRTPKGYKPFIKILKSVNK